jgi:hypothetical protein
LQAFATHIEDLGEGPTLTADPVSVGLRMPEKLSLMKAPPDPGMAQPLELMELAMLSLTKALADPGDGPAIGANGASNIKPDEGANGLWDGPAIGVGLPIDAQVVEAGRRMENDELEDS